MNLPNEPDFMGAVYDLLSYVTGLDADRIIRGYQSREILPTGGSWCIFTPITRTRIGTNVTELLADDVPDPQNAIERDSSLIRVDIQLDFYGKDAQRLAQGIETFAGALRCNQWLEQTASPIRVQYASNPIDGTMIDETKQYIPRWITTLSISFVTATEDGIPWFEDVRLHGWKKDDKGNYTPASKAGLVNADVYFKP